MPRYSAFIALATGDYQEVDWIIEAGDPRSAAQAVIDANVIDPGDDFPLVLIVEEQAVSVFTRDRDGQVTVPTSSIERRLREREAGPRLRVVTDHQPDAPG